MRALLIALAATVMLAAPLAPAAAQAPAAAATPAFSTVEVRENGMVARLFVPAGLEGKAPAIIALGGSEGGLKGSDRIGRRLAAEGYVVLALSYFGEEGQSAALTEIPLETFDRGLDWLLARPEVDPARIGMVGVSKGAEAALLAASRRPEIRVVVVGAPTSVAWQGIDFSDWTPKSSWSAGGEPLPYAPYANTGAFAGLRDLYDRSLPAAGSEGAAAIAVERIEGDILLVSGGKDGLWAATPMSERIVARLRDKGFRHRVEHLAYPEAGHGVFGSPVTPEQAAALAQVGGTAEANMAARADAWPKILAFLADALRH